MCPPVIQSITFNQTTYTAGSTITATVNYTACCPGPFSAAGFDNGNRKWIVQTDDHQTIATLTAVA
jgi:hypothetical protein